MTSAADSASGREGEPTREELRLADNICMFAKASLKSSLHAQCLVEAKSLRAAACREAVREATTELEAKVKRLQIALNAVPPLEEVRQMAVKEATEPLVEALRSISGLYDSAIGPLERLKQQNDIARAAIRAYAARLEEMKGTS